jgi:glutamate-ammonia-ligase adenylyltransferase
MPADLPKPDPSGASADHSRFVQRVRRRYAAELQLLPPGLPDASTLTDLAQQLQAQGRPLASALRVLRQLVLERLAVLDVEQSATLDQVTGTMTLLAEVTLEIALAAARADEDARSGPPLDSKAS